MDAAPGCLPPPVERTTPKGAGPLTWTPGSRDTEVRAWHVKETRNRPGLGPRIEWPWKVKMPLAGGTSCLAVALGGPAVNSQSVTSYNREKQADSGPKNLTDSKRGL